MAPQYTVISPLAYMAIDLFLNLTPPLNPSSQSPCSQHNTASLSRSLMLANQSPLLEEPSSESLGTGTSI